MPLRFRLAFAACAALALLLAYQVGRQLGYMDGARDANRVCYCARGL